MTRYLITGATTPPAKALVRTLLSREDTELVLVVGGEATRNAVSDSRLVQLRIDLRRERSIRELVFGRVRDDCIRVVIDMATHRSSRVQGRGAHAINVDETRRLLRFVERVPSAQRFVYRSFGSVYRIAHDLPSIIDEDHPLRLGPRTPQYILDRVEADLAVCARMGMSRLQIAVLRTAECLAPEAGSQLWDYLHSRVCIRPVGFDPMFNVISQEDLADALARAAITEAQGIFNIPGRDTLPLSRMIDRFGRIEIAAPTSMLHPLYALRRAMRGGDFRFDLMRERLRFGFVLDGARARAQLGYAPRHPVRWPLSIDEVGRRAQRNNPRSLRGRIEDVL